MFAQIILPLSLAETFTYEIPFELEGNIAIGHRVVVEFNGKKLYTAIVESIHNIKPENYSVKSIISILDKNPIILPYQIDFWKFIAQYYMSSLGEVYRCAIPSALKLESETFIRLRREKELDFSQLDEYETLIIQAVLNKTSINVKEIEAYIPKKFIINTLKYF